MKIGQEYRELFKSIDSCEEFMVDQIPNDEDWIIKEVDHDIVIEQTVEYQYSTVKLTKKCAYIELVERHKGARKLD